MIRSGKMDEGVLELERARLLPPLASGEDPWEFFSSVEEDVRRAYGVVLESAIHAMGSLLRQETNAGSGSGARAGRFRELLRRISSMAHPQLS